MPDFRAVFPDEAMKNCVFKAIILKGNADLVVFDNSGTDLEAHNVNDAIVELNDKIEHSTDDYYTKEETDEKLALKADESELANYYTKSESDTLLDAKADADSVYTKTEADDLLAVKADKTDLEDFYTKSQADALLGGKADADSVYTKTESDNLLSVKADASSVYTKSQTDELLNAKVDETALESDYYDKDDVDSLLSAKANASEVYTKAETDAEISALIDDAHVANNKAWSSEKINSELYDILPVDSASGSIASFSTSLALPLVSLKASIVATESGSGTKSPTNPYTLGGFSNAVITKSGANLFDEVMELGVLDNNGNIQSSTSNLVSTNKFAVKGGATLYFSCVKKTSTNQRYGVAFYDKDQNFISGSNSIIQTNTFTTPSNACYMRFFVPLSWYVSSTYENDISINGNSTDTAYHPYTTATQTTLALGQTVYGGEIVLTKKASGYGVKLRVYPHYPSYNGETLTGKWLSSMDNYVAGTTPTIGADVVDLSGAVYTEIDLTDASDIVALVGVNNVWSDTGDMEVSYKLSIEEYVANKIAEITNNRSLNASLLRGSEELREDEALPLSDELAREAITEPENREER